ncbi:HIT domain-containing protein [Gordonia sp. TBRC 11910]|uniref:HIT domain-containing protein n=1 Tax=Gordonia asplenii TaxID=2725283 RepID=A0A848KVE9_9ACTN|nr:HIT domain-containing protein [Gordonia asplenii]NMO00845.1 HIT domain-containing protein [Gordonia asplenii]
MSEYQDDCPFCEYAKLRPPRAAHERPYTVAHCDVGPTSRRVFYHRMSPVMWFEPLNPVIPGHMLFVPTYHAEHRSPEAAAAAFRCAYGYATDGRDTPFNLILSSGSAATQTIPHVHVHYLPRHEGDRLLLPWSARDANASMTVEERAESYRRRAIAARAVGDLKMERRWLDMLARLESEA